MVKIKMDGRVVPHKKTNNTLHTWIDTWMKHEGMEIDEQIHIKTQQNMMNYVVKENDDSVEANQRQYIECAKTIKKGR